MAKPYIDLHLHTLFSDGVSTPEQVAEEAQKMGLAAIALTDHDTIEGCPRLAKACAERGIEFVPGTELSTDIEGHEMHLLGYFLDTMNEELIRETTRYQQNATRQFVIIYVGQIAFNLIFLLFFLLFFLPFFLFFLFL